MSATSRESDWLSIENCPPRSCRFIRFRRRQSVHASISEWFAQLHSSSQRKRALTAALSRFCSCSSVRTSCPQLSSASLPALPSSEPWLVHHPWAASRRRKSAKITVQAPAAPVRGAARFRGAYEQSKARTSTSFCVEHASAKKTLVLPQHPRLHPLSTFPATPRPHSAQLQTAAKQSKAP